MSNGDLWPGLNNNDLNDTCNFASSLFHQARFLPLPVLKTIWASCRQWTGRWKAASRSFNISRAASVKLKANQDNRSLQIPRYSLWKGSCGRDWNTSVDIPSRGEPSGLSPRLTSAAVRLAPVDCAYESCRCRGRCGDAGGTMVFVPTRRSIAAPPSDMYGHQP
jgi:hypothetical protein